MNSKLSLSVVIVLLMMMFACNSAKETKSGYTLTGTIEGITDGIVRVIGSSSAGPIKDTAVIKEGKFVLKGNLPTPVRCFITVGENSCSIVYIENAEMNLTADIKDFQNLVLTGSKSQDSYVFYKKEFDAINAKYTDVKAKYKEISLTGNKLGQKEMDELVKRNAQKYKELDALKDRFIKEYPSSAHTVSLVLGMLPGKSYVEAKAIIKGMAPVVQKHPKIVKALAEIAKGGVQDVSVKDYMANVKDVAYKVDDKFQGSNLKNVMYLGLMSNNNICTLKKDGTVELVTPTGKVVNSFKTGLARVSSIAVDTNDDIYVMCPIMEKVVKKFRGRSIEGEVPVGVECNVFSAKGEKQATYSCEGIVSASGAKIVDNNLVVADSRDPKIAMFDKTNGKKGAVINDLRACCGILDFSINAKKEILVANLGAFRVQGFDFSGKSILSFGQRGKSLDDFHGCCNPVSVASLHSGAIVTVEKDPTRIKVYCKTGAKQIAGIEELVAGCSYIPMITDADDNLYLASKDKGLVKCVAVN